MLFLLFSCAPMQAQSFSGESVTLSGVVLTSAGLPVPGARFDYAMRGPVSDVRTDSQGRFSFSTASRLIVVRKPGFISQVVPVTANRELRLILQQATRSVGACSAESVRSCGRGTSEFTLCFPDRSGVQVSKPTRDIDYTLRWYQIKAGRGQFGIRHGRGPNWSSGHPRAELIQSSLQYEEVVYDDGGEWGIVDSRGTAADGKRWRFLGVFGETASYAGVDATVAVQFDRILDAICLTRR